MHMAECLLKILNCQSKYFGWSKQVFQACESIKCRKHLNCIVVFTSTCTLW